MVIQIFPHSNKYSLYICLDSQHITIPEYNKLPKMHYYFVSFLEENFFWFWKMSFYVSDKICRTPHSVSKTVFFTASQDT